MLQGDSEQTVQVLVAYYRQKTESLMYLAGLAQKDKFKIDSVVSSNLNIHKPVVSHNQIEYHDQ